MPPLTIPRLNALAGEHGIPEDWWKYQVFRNGEPVQSAVTAEAGPCGRVRMGIAVGKFADLAPGAVEIRLKANFREAEGEERPAGRVTKADTALPPPPPGQSAPERVLGALEALFGE